MVARERYHLHRTVLIWSSEGRARPNDGEGQDKRSDGEPIGCDLRPVGACRDENERW